MAHSHKQYERRKNSIFRALLGIPVFYKVLIANSLIIFIGATGGKLLATHLNTSPRATPWAPVVFFTICWVVSVVLHFVGFPLALPPLFHLGKVIKHGRGGGNVL